MKAQYCTTSFRKIGFSEQAFDIKRNRVFVLGAHAFQPCSQQRLPVLARSQTAQQSRTVGKFFSCVLIVTFAAFGGKDSLALLMNVNIVGCRWRLASHRWRPKDQRESRYPKGFHDSIALLKLIDFVANQMLALPMFHNSSHAAGLVRSRFIAPR